MTHLTIFSDENPAPVRVTGDPAAIAAELATIGVRFERWRASAPVQAGASQDEVLAAYATDIERLKTDGGYTSCDVVSIAPDHPQRAEMRKKFLAEHRHAEDEVRFFVDGCGTFYLHVDGRVHMVRCEKGDLLLVPAGTPHWFDMGPAPRFVAIRLFTNPEGWVAQFTGDAIAQRFPEHP